MKKVLEIRDLFGEKLPLDKMEIVHTGSNWVMARFIGYGFLSTYAPHDGYTVIFED